VHVLFFPTAVQVERTPYPVKEHKLSTRRTKSTGSLQQSPTTSRNFATMDMPFPYYSFGPTSNMLNSDAKDQALPTSVMLEMLRKADEAENSAVLPSPTAGDEKLPENTRRSLISVISWVKKIPSFTQLPIDDQIKLVKESWNIVNTLKLIHHITKFPNGSDSAFKSNEVDHLYLTDNPEVVSSMQILIKESASTMWEIQLDEIELSCLKLITLMNPSEYYYSKMSMLITFHILYSLLVIHSLTASGQKEIECTQDTGLKLLEAHVQKSKLRPSQRMTKLLLFHGQVKTLTKDISAIIEEILGSKGDSALLKLISQNLN